MKKLTIKDIRELKPCYDPIKYLSEDWAGTVLDILNVQDCMIADRLWVGLRLVDRETLYKFIDKCGIRERAAYDAVYDAYDAYDDAGAGAAFKKERQKQLDILINIIKETV